MKIKESQLRSIIRNTLNEMMNEGRPQIKPSYFLKEDYKDVEGVELYVPDPLKLKNPKLRNPEVLKNAFMLYSALYAKVDEDGGVRAYFYHGNVDKYMDGPVAAGWDEDAWRQTTAPKDNNGTWPTDEKGNITGHQPMKGVAKTREVLLYQYVPNFEKMWNDQRKRTIAYRKAEDAEEQTRYGKGERETAYNTVPTIHGSGGMVNETKSVKINESELREIIIETLNEMLESKK